MLVIFIEGFGVWSKPWLLPPGLRPHPEAIGKKITSTGKKICKRILWVSGPTRVLQLGLTFGPLGMQHSTENQIFGENFSCKTVDMQC